MNSERSGTRQKGRPIKRQLDNICEDCGVLGLSLAVAGRLANDKTLSGDLLCTVWAVSACMATALLSSEHIQKKEIVRRRHWIIITRCCIFAGLLHQYTRSSATAEIARDADEKAIQGHSRSFGVVAIDAAYRTY